MDRYESSSQSGGECVAVCDLRDRKAHPPENIS